MPNLSRLIHAIGRALHGAEILLMLTLITLLFLVPAYFVDTVRSRALSWAGRSLDQRLSPLALRTSLHEATTRGVRATWTYRATSRSSARS